MGKTYTYYLPHSSNAKYLIRWNQNFQTLILKNWFDFQRLGVLSLRAALLCTQKNLYFFIELHATVERKGCYSKCNLTIFSWISMHVSCSSITSLWLMLAIQGLHLGWHLFFFKPQNFLSHIYFDLVVEKLRFFFSGCNIFNLETVG